MDLAIRKFVAATALALLAACQSTPNLEDDARYIKFAKVLDVHEFTDAERKEAAKTAPRSHDSGVGMGIGIGMGSGGGFGGIMLGATTPIGGGRNDRYPPNAAFGANRFTVQPVHTQERIEVMSYGKFQVGDCVKLMSGHPSEYARLFDLNAGERCE